MSPRPVPCSKLGFDLPYHRVAGVLKRGGRQMPDQRPSVQAARIRALNSAQGEATRAKVLALDDEGRLRAEIAAELGLSPKYVAELLAGVGRTVSEAERIARSRAARNAQGAALRAEILALDDLGRSRQEIAEQLGRSYGHVCNVLVRAGRKAPVSARLDITIKRAHAVTAARGAATRAAHHAGMIGLPRSIRAPAAD